MDAGNVRTGPPPSSKIESTYHELAALMGEIARPDRHHGLRADPHDLAPLLEATERMTDFVLARLGAGQGSRVLDVGCGDGRPAVRLARTLGARVVAIDIDRRALRDGAEHAAAQGVEELVRFRRVDATDLPFADASFADASFDAVLAFEVTPHLDIAPLYRGVARVLRPGGRLVVETPYPRVPMTEEIRERAGSRLAMPDAASLDTPEDHLSAARRAGMAVTELVDVTEDVRDSFSPLTRGPREHGTRPDTGRPAPDIARAPGTARTPGTAQTPGAMRTPGVFAAWAGIAEVGGVVMTFTRMEQ